MLNPFIALALHQLARAPGLVELALHRLLPLLALENLLYEY